MEVRMEDIHEVVCMMRKLIIKMKGKGNVYQKKISHQFLFFIFKYDSLAISIIPPFFMFII